MGDNAGFNYFDSWLTLKSFDSDSLAIEKYIKDHPERNAEELRKHFNHNLTLQLNVVEHYRIRFESGYDSESFFKADDVDMEYLDEQKLFCLDCLEGLSPIDFEFT